MGIDFFSAWVVLIPMGIGYTERGVKPFSCPPVSRCFQALHPVQDEFHQFCPWDVSQVVLQTAACPGGCRLIPYDTSTHHFLLSPRVVLPFTGTSTWLVFLFLLHKQKRGAGGKCENGKIMTCIKGRNVACTATSIPFLSPAPRLT